MNVLLKRMIFVESLGNAVVLLVLFFLCCSQSILALNENQNLFVSNIRVVYDQRPTDLEYVLMSKHAYNEEIQIGQVLDNLPTWKVYEIVTGGNDYRGVVFENVNTHHFVVAHRGTNPKSIGNLIEDIQGVVRGKTSLQELDVYKLAERLVNHVKRNKGYSISFTGHSLGAFLADLSVFFCCKDLSYPEANAVTFENPGSQEALEILQSQLKEHKLPIENMDIIGYVASPNAINTFNHHVGSMYLIEPNLSNPEWRLDPTWYTRESHSIDNIVRHLISTEGTANLPYYISDWPIADWSAVGGLVDGTHWILKIGRLLYSFSDSQRRTYFKYTKLEENSEGSRYKLVVNENDVEAIFHLSYTAHYPIKDIIQREHDTKTSLPLKHFGKGMQVFLSSFYRTLYNAQSRNSDIQQKLYEEFKLAKVPEKIIRHLFGFDLVQRKDGIWIVTLLKADDKTSIHEFREELSKYLQDNSEIIKTALLNHDNHFANIGLLVKKGSTVNEIVNSTLKGIEYSFKNVRIEKIIKILKTDDASNYGIKIEPDAKVDSISNVEAVGKKVNIDDSSDPKVKDEL